MTPLHSHCLDLDLHRLDLRFAGSRLVEPHAVARLAEPIERCGQIVPCIVVAIPGDGSGGAEALVLIDGYRRVAALRRLGRDTAGVEQWSCDLTQALLGVLARAQDRPFASIEQALLLRAERLLATLAGTPLTTRELRCWFEHYQQASRSARERMVSQPRLFIDTLRANEAHRAGKHLRDGPEGECLGDLRCLEAVIARLRKRVATLRPVPPLLVAAAPRLRTAIDALATALEQEDTHGPDRDPHDGAHPADAGAQPARDQPPAGPVA